MATRNLFRFVSVRPPIPEVVDNACRLINMEAGTEFVLEVLTRQREHREVLQVARRAVSVAFINSEEYFVRNETWEDLRPLREHFQGFLAGVCRREEKPGEAVEEPDEGLDVEASLREIEKYLGERVGDWVVSDSFATAKNILWRSYYANALAPEMRPHDRPEMLDWIRIVDALERLRPPGEAEWRYDEAGCVCVGRLSRARVYIPHELFAEMPVEAREPSTPTDTVKQDIDTIHASLERLKALRLELELLYRRKVNALRLASPPDRELVPVESAQPEGGQGAQPEGGQGAQPEGGQAAQPEGGGKGARPPWLLTEEDEAKLPDLGAELERLGVPLAGATVPEVVEALNKVIAVNTAALSELESPVDVVGIGATMWLARRTLRGFRPAQRGSTGRAEKAEPQTEKTEQQGQESAT